MTFPVPKKDLDIIINSTEEKYYKILNNALKTHTTHFLLEVDGKKIISIKPKNDTNIHNKLVETFSITKSIIGLAFMFLLQDGLLSSISNKVSSYILEWKYDKRRNITIKDLLTQTSKLQNNWNFYKFSDINKYGKKVNKYHLNIKELSKQIQFCDYSKSDIWDYNNDTSQTLITLIEIISKQPPEQYIKAKLFTPLKVRYIWRKDRYGNCFGPLGINTNVNGLYKIGKLILNNGIWNGKIILKSDLIKKMLNKQVDSRKMKDYGKYDANYALLWYNIKNELFFASGYLGNKLFINPDKKIICVRLVNQFWDNDLFRTEVKNKKLSYGTLTKLIYNL